MVDAQAVVPPAVDVRHTSRTSESLHLRDYAVLLAFAWLVGIGGILGRPLEGHDEPRVAGIARAMALSGDYVTPRLNGRPFLEYPSLGYVPAAVGLRIAGRASELAARLPYALLGGVTVCLAGWAGAALGGRRRGVAAGLLLETTLGFLDLQQKLVVDPLLVLFVTLSLAGFIHAWRRGSRLGAVCFWLGMAGGFLSKGLIGIGVPIVSACGFLMAMKLRRMRAGGDEIVRGPVGWTWGPFVLAAPIALWMTALQHSSGGTLALEVIGQSVQRFASEHADHASPWFTYLKQIPYLTLPLLLLAILDLRGSRRRAPRPPPALGEGFLFPAAWLGLGLLALSLASAKRTAYLGPLYPGAALLGALLWERARPCIAIPRAWACAWLVVAAAGSIGVGRLGADHRDRTDGVRALFEFVRAERADRTLVLYRPSEGLEGATVFFTSETAPEADGPETLRAALDAHGRALVLADIGARGVDPDLALPGVEARKLRDFSLGASRVGVWVIDRRG